MTDEIEKAEFQKETSDVLARTITGIAEGLTGIAASKREGLILSVGYILQSIRSGQFLNTLLKEWNKYREKGRIKEDYEFTGSTNPVCKNYSTPWTKICQTKPDFPS